MSSPQPGEVWLADLGLAAKTRPVIVVSRFDPDAPRALVLFVPLTTQNRMSRYEEASQNCRSWIKYPSPTSRDSHPSPLFASNENWDGFRLPFWPN
jgi:hypothetical protein